MSLAPTPPRYALWDGGWYRYARRLPSPNCGPRPPDAVVDLLVLHSITLPPGVYGGDDPNDNSGILRYVRVEFAGIEFSPDNELNGIAFQGVGRGTIVENIQVSWNKDDGIEMFGGSVDIKRVVLTNIGDDSIALAQRGAAEHFQPSPATCWKTTPAGRSSTTLIGSTVGMVPLFATVMMYATVAPGRAWPSIVFCSESAGD